jgi:hypothetical protein
MGQRLAQEAELIFASASKDVRGLDAAFTAIEALIPSCVKDNPLSDQLID